MRNLIVGCGYLGLRVARKWIEQNGVEVLALTRSPERAATLRDYGLEPLIGDVTAPASLSDLSRQHLDTVLYAVGFDRTAGPSMHEVYVHGLRTVLDLLQAPPPARFIYISSTGVYGGSDGSERLDEDSPCRPTREGGRVCLEAEELLRRHPLGQRAIILRLAGIYGPNRLPRREALLRGQPIEADPQGYLNLIHVEDAANAVLACHGLDELPTTLIISDGHPVRRQDYYGYAAQLIGAPPPEFAPREGAGRGSAEGSAKRQLCNDRMLAELRLKLTYPSYRQGLAEGLKKEQ